ncbi:MAG: di-heme enzyme [Bdellovibrionota bacterium]
MAVPAIPDFNPPTAEKIELGRYLFYDKRLSANEMQSCASCHQQSLAFTDGRVRSVGSTGQVHRRNAQALGNAVYHATLTWSNKSFLWLEDQIEIPLLSDNPIELGVTDSERATVIARFSSDESYRSLFAAAYDGSNEVTVNKIIFALASFCRTLISGNSSYDRFLRGDDSALTEQQKRGFALFNGERFECFHCHSGINFSSSYRDSNSDPIAFARPFFNNGLYNVGGNGSYPLTDQGLYDLTLDPNDRGLFRPQSLRNVELTAPYMHDGSIATLRDVVEHYARGGRIISEGPNAGDGRLSPLKSGLIRGFQASEEEKEDVVAFLRSLTDWDFVSEPRHSNPFPN